jgi:DNA-binding response OmpR family regulator
MVGPFPSEVCSCGRSTMATKRLIAGTREHGKKSSEERFRLLLVEDDELVATGLVTILELEGYSVLLIGRGLAVVEAARSFEPDSVILDLSLPDIDGIEVFRRLRKRWPDLPVIFSTGDSTSQDLSSALKCPRVELMRKPYEIKDLLAALRRINE